VKKSSFSSVLGSINQQDHISICFFASLKRICVSTFKTLVTIPTLSVPEEKNLGDQETVNSETQAPKVLSSITKVSTL